MNGSTIAVVILAVFGGVWCVYGSSTLSRLQRAWIMPGAVLVSVGLIVAGIYHTTYVEQRFALPAYYASVAFEGIAIGIAIAVLRRRNARSLIGPAIAVIVGLHFVGLFAATGDRLFLYLCAALCAVGLGAMACRPAFRTAIAGFGSGFVLWATGISMVVR